MKLSQSLAIAITVASILSLNPSKSHALAAVTDLTLSPVKTALETIVSPFATSGVGAVATSQQAANREIIANAVANDAADNIGGADASPLLEEMQSMLRDELAKRGDNTQYDAKQLSQMILGELAQAAHSPAESASL